MKRLIFVFALAAMFAACNTTAPEATPEQLPVNVSLRRNANGRLVLRQGSTNFLIEIRSADYIRIRRYDGSGTQAADGVSLELFYKQTRNGPRWVSLDNAFVLRNPALTIQSQ